MRHIPDDLAARIESGAARLCHVWLMRRVDGTRAGFTDHDRDLTLDGVVCRAASGWTAGAAESAVGLAAGTASASGVLDDASIREADVAAGRLDGAAVELWRLDWSEPGLGVRLWSGTITRLRRQDGAFVADLEGPLAELERVSPEQACAHPNWSMGRKISVDSASMMNKGLELIEACWLFDAKPAQVEVVVHPQSVIHSLVDYVDGSVLAQLGNPDMRTPISHALAWPERIDSGVAPLDLFAVARLDFQAPDEQRFPCLRLARQAAEAGGTAPAMLNAANEVAVTAFLERRIRFPEIARIIESVLKADAARAVESLDTVLAADKRARSLAQQCLGGSSRGEV